jgi:ATP-dependent RNA helicase SUPV3L1/SUV3
MMRLPANSSRVAAVLGPTNTGKTHFAVERMLAHGSGVMGFPLRLLAREIYDRVVGLVGADAVALSTGEEQVGSETARFVLATVEAMPMQRQFAFLAVDEIQLCADRERGHVFTDRLLHARGAEETLFLGSDTIRPLLKQLVPEAEIVTRPRFSILRHNGSTKLNRLPRRSAVVAFTAADVYTLAEVMRRQKGGAAVVLGALSPRTRNAQVAMYQSGEVDHLVATDAIGMGLNMDLGHVAFAQLHKFDGNDTRRLTAPEIGQIAGRAGRHMSDGTFGTTNGSEPLDERIIEAVEAHRFMPIKRLRWRNSDLDFASLEDLAASLDADPPSQGLIKVRDALDDRSLGILARRDDIRARARSPASVRLLWQICQIPDFRKTLTDAHLHMLATVFKHLTDDAAVLPGPWVGSMIARLDRMDGDIDALVTRIAHVRTWTYLSHRHQWFDDPLHWQGLARSVEDRLSDALHERLTQKFVDRRTAALLKSLRERGELAAEIEPGGEVVVDGHPVGTLEGFAFTLGASGLAAEHRLFAGAARRAVTQKLNRLAADLVREPDDAFTIADREIRWRGAVVGMLLPGPSLLRPAVTVTATDELALKARLAIERRLAQRLKNWLDERLQPLMALDAASRSGGLSAAARGIAYRLVEGLGSLTAGDAEALTRQLQAPDRRDLARLGVRLGVHHLYLPALLKPAAQEALALLVALAKGTRAWQPAAGRVALRVAEWPAEPAALTALGYRRMAGDTALRVDIVERLAARLRELARSESSFALPDELVSTAGLGRDEFLALLPSLGFRVEPPPVMVRGADACEAPATGPAIRISRAKPRRQRRTPEHRKVQARQGPSHSPFAVLAQLKAVGA